MTLIKITLAIGLIGLICAAPAKAGQPSEWSMPHDQMTKERMDVPKTPEGQDPGAPEVAKPMQAPNGAGGEGEKDHPGYRPLCGPWKNAIRHVYCSDGYDTISF
jgi:hypothetical protein